MKDGRTHLAHKAEHAERDAVYANRRRIHGERGQRLLRKRGELLERPNAHLYETGGMRRVHLRGHTNILKRILVHASGFNLGLMMRRLIGVGTPRGLQGRQAIVIALVIRLWARMAATLTPQLRSRHRRHETACGLVMASFTRLLKVGTCTTAC